MKKFIIVAIILISFCSTAFAEVPIVRSGTQYYTVQSGDTLWEIANAYATTVTELKRLNNLTSDYLYIGQELLTVSTGDDVAKDTYINYTVQKNDTLYIIAETFGVTIASIKSGNGLQSNTIYVGEILKIMANFDIYRVVSGDTLWEIALKYKTSVNKIKIYSGISSDILYIGQVLKIPSQPTNPAPPPSTNGYTPYITYTSHTVASGDEIWGLSIKYGVPMPELLKVNNLTQNSILNIGQVLKVPVHHIPVIPTNSGCGEYLDWFTQAQYVFPIGKVAVITDFYTGKSYNVKRTIGASHADCEPVTSSDTAIIKALFGGFTWKTRPILVKVDGRTIAASMSFYPHGVQYISGNNFEGHFDLYFKNSIRHSDGLPDPSHTASVKIAAGY